MKKLLSANIKIVKTTIDTVSTGGFGFQWLFMLIKNNGYRQQVFLQDLLDVS